MKIAYPIPIFNQNVVVTADRDQKENHLHVVEDVNPLLSLRPLAADIKHTVGQVSKIEDSLGDACGP